VILKEDIVPLQRTEFYQIAIDTANSVATSNPAGVPCTDGGESKVLRSRRGSRA
jgi:hypothetical protein